MRASLTSLGDPIVGKFCHQVTGRYSLSKHITREISGFIALRKADLGFTLMPAMEEEGEVRGGHHISLVSFLLSRMPEV